MDAIAETILESSLASDQGAFQLGVVVLIAFFVIGVQAFRDWALKA